MSEVAQEVSDWCKVDAAVSETRCAMCDTKFDVTAWSGRVELRVGWCRIGGECNGMCEESAECSQWEIDDTGTVRDVERCCTSWEGLDQRVDVVDVILGLFRS